MRTFHIHIHKQNEILNGNKIHIENSRRTTAKTFRPPKQIAIYIFFLHFFVCVFVVAVFLLAVVNNNKK